MMGSTKVVWGVPRVARPRRPQGLGQPPLKAATKYPFHNPASACPRPQQGRQGLGQAPPIPKARRDAGKSPGGRRLGQGSGRAGQAFLPGHVAARRGPCLSSGPLRGARRNECRGSGVRGGLWRAALTRKGVPGAALEGRAQSGPPRPRVHPGSAPRVPRGGGEHPRSTAQPRHSRHSQGTALLGAAVLRGAINQPPAAAAAPHPALPRPASPAPPGAGRGRGEAPALPSPAPSAHRAAALLRVRWVTLCIDRGTACLAGRACRGTAAGRAVAWLAGGGVDGVGVLPAGGGTDAQRTLRRWSHHAGAQRVEGGRGRREKGPEERGREGIKMTRAGRAEAQRWAGWRVHGRRSFLVLRARGQGRRRGGGLFQS